MPVISMYGLNPHRDELMADWELAIAGEALYKIDPL